MNRPDEPTSLQPMPEPGEDALATLLAEVLTSEAARIEPSDRLADIRGAASQRRRSWGPVAAGAAAVMLIGGGAWAVVDRTGQGTKPPAIASSPTPTASPTPTSSPSPTPSSSVGTWAAPIYYPGRNVTGLFREFHGLPLTPGPLLSHLNDAFRVMLDPASPNRPDQVMSPWLVGTSDAFQLSMAGKTLVVTLPDSEKTARGATPEQARLAAQQLVWTASAVAQDAQLGVRITFAHSGGKLFGVLATDRTFRRPPAGQNYEDLSAIWLLKPETGATVTSSVTISGQACTFEGNVAWDLARGSTVVRSGHLTTRAACPTRSPWTLSLRGLSPGAYTFRAFELSAQDGTSYEGLDTTAFTVR
jgi:hypothetical protein